MKDRCVGTSPVFPRAGCLGELWEEDRDHWPVVSPAWGTICCSGLFSWEYTWGGQTLWEWALARWLETDVISCSASLKRTHTANPERYLKCVSLLFLIEQSYQHLKAKPRSTITSCSLTLSLPCASKRGQEWWRSMESLGPWKAWNIPALTTSQFYFSFLWPIFPGSPLYISHPHLWYEKSPSSENSRYSYFLKETEDNFLSPILQTQVSLSIDFVKALCKLYLWQLQKGTSHHRKKKKVCMLLQSLNSHTLQLTYEAEKSWTQVPGKF